MAISINVNSSIDQNSRTSGNRRNSENTKKTTGASFAGANGDPSGNALVQKKKEAQQKAYKIVSDAFENEKSIDNSIEERRTLRSQKLQEMNDYKDEANSYMDKLKTLKETYNIADDSKQQKDLEFLEGYMDKTNGLSDESLTFDDIKKRAEIMSQPLTEYQRDALGLYTQATTARVGARNAQNTMMDATADITSIKQSRLKSHAMVDAQKQGDQLIDASNDTIVGMAMQAAMEHQDEINQENQDKQKKLKDDKKDEEKKQEKIDERQALEEAVIEGTRQAVEDAVNEQKKNNQDDTEIDYSVISQITDTSSKDVSNSLDELKNSMKLLEADLKGIKVDTEL